MEKANNNKKRKCPDDFDAAPERDQGSRSTFQTMYQKLKEKELGKKNKVEELRAQMIRAKREYSDARLDTFAFEEAYNEVVAALVFFTI